MSTETTASSKAKHRWWAAVVVVVAIGAIAVAVGLMVAAGIGADSPTGPENLYQRGRTAFEAGLWADAIDAWDHAVGVQALSRRAQHAQELARQYLPLAKANQAADTGDWQAVHDHIAAARRAGIPPQTITPVEQRLQRHEQLAGLIDRFNRHLDAKQFDDAQATLTSLAGQPSEQIDALQARLDQAKQRDEHEQARLAAQQAIAQGDYPAAEAALRQAIQLDDSPDLHEQLQTVVLRQNMTELLTAADKARSQKDYATEVVMLTQAQQLGNSAELDRRIAEARAGALMVRGDQLIQTGQLDEAHKALNESIRHHPRDDAQQLLAKVDQLLQRKQWLSQADAAMAEQAWDRALEAYQNAGRIQSDEYIAAHIRRSQYQILLARGDDLMAQQQWEDAFASYQDAQALGDPGPPQERIDSLQIARERYLKLTEADAFTEAGHYDRAMRILRQLKRTAPGPDIDERVTETNYQRYLAAGKVAMAAGNVRLARSNFYSAKRHKVTPELETLLAKTQPPTATQPDNIKSPSP